MWISPGNTVCPEDLTNEGCWKGFVGRECVFESLI